jgi:sugar (pentulose or hexulose) kinase
MGIDLGSSSAKAVLADEHGDIVARASAPQHVSRPQPGAAEQHAS